MNGPLSLSSMTAQDRRVAGLAVPPWRFAMVCGFLVLTALMSIGMDGVALRTCPRAVGLETLEETHASYCLSQLWFTRCSQV